MCFLRILRPSKGYHYYSLVLHRLFVSADVTFFETTSYDSEPHTISDPDFMLPTPPKSLVSHVISTPEISSHLDCPNLESYSRHRQNVVTILELLLRQ